MHSHKTEADQTKDAARQMKVLLTGSEGNIGSRLIPYLKSCGHDVFRTDQIQKVDDNYMVVNITCFGDMHEAFRRFTPDVVIHLAAMVSRMTCETSAYLTVETNVSGLNNVIQLSKIFGAKIIYFSTSEVYGNIGGYLSEDRLCEPNNRYGLSKWIGEKLIEYEVKDGLKAVIVRPFMFYDEKETRGEHRSAMIRFAMNLSMRRKVTVHRNSIRSWMHISDGVKVIEKLMHCNTFEIVNVGSPQIIRTQELARMMCNYLGISYDQYVYEIEVPDKMTANKYPDVRKQLELTGIQAEVPIEEGVKLVLKEFGYDKV